jgi:hypothetical protein
VDARLLEVQQVLERRLSDASIEVPGTVLVIAPTSSPRVVRPAIDDLAASLPSAME